jgi:hypothetical protein
MELFPKLQTAKKFIKKEERNERKERGKKD